MSVEKSERVTICKCNSKPITGTEELGRGKCREESGGWGDGG